MTQLNKMLVQLEKINGSIKLKQDIDLSRYCDEQICQQAKAGNRVFIKELLRRAEAMEIESDFVMATELYKILAKGVI